MKVEELDRVNNVAIVRGDTDTVYTENVARRLMWLEAFVFLLIEKDREFSAWEEKEENGKTVTRTLTEGEVFSYFFGNEEEKNKTRAEMGEILKQEYLERQEKERINEINRKKEAARVAKLRAEQAIKAKELEALKAEGAKKRRAAYEIEHEKELRTIALKKEEKEEYEQALKSATEDGEDIYIGGSGMKKLKSPD